MEGDKSMILRAKRCITIAKHLFYSNLPSEVIHLQPSQFSPDRH